MLDIGDIEAAFVVWRAAGLTPPPMNDVQRENFMAKTLEQYKYTQVKDWAEAVEWVRENVKTTAGRGRIIMACKGKTDMAYGLEWKYESSTEGVGR